MAAPVVWVFARKEILWPVAGSAANRRAGVSHHALAEPIAISSPVFAWKAVRDETGGMSRDRCVVVLRLRRRSGTACATCVHGGAMIDAYCELQQLGYFGRLGLGLLFKIMREEVRRFPVLRRDRPADPPGTTTRRRDTHPNPTRLRPTLVHPPTPPPSHRPLAPPER